MARRRVGLWLLVALAVAAQCWIYRDVMTPGGLSSIAVGEAIIRANWREAVNGWWSPLYGLLIGLVTEMFRPSAAVEFGFVRFTDFLIFAATIPCFEFFLRNLIRFNRYRGNYERGELFRPIPVWVFYFIGFPLFAIASIGWISVVHHPAAIAVAGALYIVFGVCFACTCETRRPGITCGWAWRLEWPISPISARLWWRFYQCSSR